jgi:hypothetical protein
MAEENCLDAVWESAALQEIPVAQRGPIVEALMRFRLGLPSAIKILEYELEVLDHSNKRKGSVQNLLTLCLIGHRRFEDALNLLSGKIDRSDDVEIADRFNFAMCSWAKSNSKPLELFFKLAEHFDQDQEDVSIGANHPQCRALVLAAIGQRDAAIEQAREAKKRIEKSGEMAFSCWRYLNALPKDFSEDCDAIIEFAKSGRPLPIFMSKQE